MNECLFCNDKCLPGFDFHCRECQSQYHFVCRPVSDHAYGTAESPYKCFQCKRLLDNTTVSFWATNTYSDWSKELRRKDMYDVNFIHEGVIVAVQPYMFIPNQWPEFYMESAFVSMNITSEQEHWTEKNWFMITSVLSAVKPVEFAKIKR